MKIEKGIVELKYSGIKNLQTIRKAMEIYTEKYKGIVVTEESLKGCKETLAEIKPVRTDIKKFRADLNKELTAQIKVKLGEVDEITQLITDVIEPIETGIEFFEEERRQKRIAEKQVIYLPAIDNINTELQEMELPDFYELKLVEWDDDWANKSDKALQQLLLDLVEEIKKEIASKKDRIDLVKTHSKLLQGEWGLIGNINWQYLKEELYGDNWKDKLSDMASAQQEQEFAVQERVERIEKEKLDAALKQQEQEIRNEIKVIPIPAIKKDDVKSIFRLDIEATDSEYRAIRDYLEILNVKVLRDVKDKNFKIAIKEL